MPPLDQVTIRLAIERRGQVVFHGTTSLFSHQARVYEAASGGEHVIVATGTASGKTLAFNLPVLNTLVADPKDPAR